MKAIVLNGHGGADALVYDESFPDPQCGENDVIVRVRATSLNYHDVFTRNGMPGIKINYKLSENSKKMLSHGISKAKELMKKAGAKSIVGFGPVRHTGWHLMGTTKMGVSKKNSVVNEFGQTHDIKNLVIADSSVFVTSGGVNPVSTLQAISLRITNEIKNYPKKYFRNYKE